MARTYGLSGGLAGAAIGQQQQAMELMGRAADQEQSRILGNEQLERERKAGNQQLGSTLGGLAGWAVGAQYGSAAGPWGAALGGLVGAVAGGLF